MDYIYMTSMAAVREASILGVDSAPTSRAQDLSKGGMGVARLFFFNLHLTCMETQDLEIHTWKFRSFGFNIEDIQEIHI